MGIVRVPSQATVPKTFAGCEYQNFVITIAYQHVPDYTDTVF
jgi:hypothetical protein